MLKKRRKVSRFSVCFSRVNWQWEIYENSNSLAAEVRMPLHSMFWPLKRKCFTAITIQKLFVWIFVHFSKFFSTPPLLYSTRNDSREQCGEQNACYIVTILLQLWTECHFPFSIFLYFTTVWRKIDLVATFLLFFCWRSHVMSSLLFSPPCFIYFYLPNSCFCK